ncbi:LysR family transcriptional regulator [Mycobacterium dioxanotrophicus]|uniref:LysR family transcriptional regulator n=1 Tax=Mycobacterium dioxanotrophicus TaxID=482462 RepID=A0A1Y0CCC5_9MYCO|nr:LysR family transcriptional regulator [Mycobacterium dioxanotrophicus]ART72913.1 LysR family transcriptional regulator [Mycobacterium dioxanotrophicus]
MNLSGVDLNLLVVLQAVLEERSATKAAARLHLTQPAVSNALARLRVLLGDPLVVRSGRGLSPTPAALAIQPRLDTALRLVDGIVHDLDDFDIATTTREWVIAFADLYGPLVLPGLDRQLQQKAPRSSVRVTPLDRISVVDALATGEIDLYLGIPTTVPSAWHSEPAFADDTVGVIAAHHPDARSVMTLERFIELPHVHVRISPGRGREVDDALARLGRTRRISLTVPHYSSLFPVVENGHCIAVAPRRLARYHARNSAISLFELPLALPPYDVRLFWHERVDNDAGTAALRSILREVLAAEPSEAGNPSPERG